MTEAKTASRSVPLLGELLAGMRIRKKLIFLHTVFSLALAGILWLALRPAVGEVVKQAERHEAAAILALLLERGNGGADAGNAGARSLGTSVLVQRIKADDARLLGAELSDPAREGPNAGNPLVAMTADGVPIAAAPDGATGELVLVSVRLDGAREAVVRLYVLMTIALLAVYALVAAALEIFVLPQHVYGPIRTLLSADRAVQEGRGEDELIPPSAMPADELGEIMRSRNSTVLSLRRHERDLAAALAQLEHVANDLKKKNHLLEAAQRNLADADKLASLGMMSAGIAHELNTPLTVLKGMVERLNADTARGVTPAEGALMLRVVQRLERLSESLLDFARVRPPRSVATPLRPLVDEAWTLVRLDREAGGAGVEFENRVGPELSVLGDPDRLLQVLVNLLRNAVDAHDGAGSAINGAGRGRGTPPRPRIDVGGHCENRDGRSWTTLTITDNGPGIDPELLSRLFQPFASTRLDARGTGLGLAVAEGIVREHGGLILARNRAREESNAGGGAVFEVVLPAPSESASEHRGGQSVESSTRRPA